MSSPGRQAVSGMTGCVASRRPPGGYHVPPETEGPCPAEYRPTSDGSRPCPPGYVQVSTSQAREVLRRFLNRASQVRILPGAPLLTSTYVS